MGLHGITVEQINEGPRPIGLASSSVIGLVGTAESATGLDAGEQVVVRGPGDVAALDLGDGTLRPALEGIYKQGGARVVVRREAIGEDDTETAASIAGSAIDQSGVYGLLKAKAKLGVKPKILIAPGFSSVSGVYGALVGVANRLLAGVLLDGPNDDAAAAISMAGAVSDPDGRAMMIDPYVITGSEEVPASGYVAGLVAQSDARFGVWRSPSNQVILGIDGTARPISFELGDPDVEAAELNGENVTTIVREDGWRLWGNRGLGTDPMTAFWTVRRTADLVAESVKTSHLWAVDQGITRGFVDAVLEGVQEFLRQLRAREAIIDGRAWADPELNTPSSLGQGQLYIDYEFTAVPVAEAITFRQRLTNEYLSQIIG